MKQTDTICIATLLCLTASIFLTACGEKDEPDKNQREFISISRSEEDIIKCNNEFAKSLIEELSEPTNRTPGNYMVSPLSLSMTLSMLANGAEGETRDEILDVLGFTDSDIATANKLNKTLLEKLPNLDRTTTLNISNSIWLRGSESNDVQPEYKDCIAEYYKASCQMFTDPNSQALIDEINSWSNEQTNGAVPVLFDKPLPYDTQLIMANALYFKGIWEYKFDKKDTTDEAFTNADNSVSIVKMMKKDKLLCEAYQDDGYTAAVINYGNTSYCMIVILPDKGIDPAYVFSNINIIDLQILARGGYFKSELNVKLPRFNIESDFNMIPTLQGLGIEKAFSQNADFSALWKVHNPNRYVDMVKQKTMIDVNEEGVTASSSTSAKVSGDISPAPAQKLDFIVDHPFAFVVAERSTGVILFAGVVNKL